MLTETLNDLVPDMLRDVLVALAPGMTHLLLGWLLLG